MYGDEALRCHIGEHTTPGPCTHCGYTATVHPEPAPTVDTTVFIDGLHDR